MDERFDPEEETKLKRFTDEDDARDLKDTGSDDREEFIFGIDEENPSDIKDDHDDFEDEDEAYDAAEDYWREQH